MKITNNHNVPATLVALASTDYYSKGKADYSVTELISPPRVQRLRRKHHTEMEQDVSGMLWQLLGTALHVVAERGQAEGYTTEERLHTTINGVSISGAIDLQQDVGHGLILGDYKFTSAWAVRQEKPEWEQQLNMYAWLVRREKKCEIAGLQIVALIRDWNRREAMAKPDYPQAPIHMVNLPIWTQERTEEYILSRIASHDDGKVAIDMEEDLPLCTDDDRWIRSTMYAVKKAGRKTAIKLFDNEAEAAARATLEKGFVEVRVGEAIRCTGNFCGVSQWCSQYQNSIKEQDDE
jgi:hypothetical protein